MLLDAIPVIDDQLHRRGFGSVICAGGPRCHGRQHSAPEERREGPRGQAVHDGGLRIRGRELDPGSLHPGHSSRKYTRCRRQLASLLGFPNPETALACPHTAQALHGPRNGTISPESGSHDCGAQGNQHAWDALWTPNHHWTPGRPEHWAAKQHRPSLTSRSCSSTPVTTRRSLSQCHAPYRLHSGICGAGVMGTGIAMANIRRGIRVKLYDASPEALDRAHNTLSGESARLASTGHPDQLFQVCPTPDRLESATC